MARQNLNRGTTANDGTGDTLRTAAQKINENFQELYLLVGGGDSAVTSVTLIESGLSFEGLTADDYETLLVVTEPTQDNTIILPDSSGTVVLDTTTQTLINKTLTSPVLTTPQINDTSADHQYVFAVGELSADRTVTLPVLSSNDTFVFANATQTLTNKTIDGLNLNNPTLGGISGGSLFFDSNGNEILETETIASAVNHIVIRNASTGNDVQIRSNGTDTNVSLNISTKGDGDIEFDSRIVFMSDTTHSGGSNLDINKPAQIFDQGSPIGVTLPDGNTVGASVYLVGKGAGTVTVTITSFAAGSTLAIAQNESAMLMWDGANWQIISNSGTVA